MPWSALQQPLSGGPAAVPAPGQLWDLRGVVHVHTSDSHDALGTIAEVQAAARANGVQWVALTEHRRGPHRGFALRTELPDGMPLLIPGWELNSDGGSILAIGVAERPPQLRTAAQEIGWIHERGGLAFVGHIEQSALLDPQRYGASGADGIELVNLHAQALARGLRFAAEMLLLPAPRALRGLLRIPPENLRHWEALPGSPPIVAGVDAHAKFRIAFRRGTLDRYRDLFRALTTHVLAEAPTAAAVIDALRAGRSYIAFESLAPVDRFEVTSVGRQLQIRAPRTARLALVCDGREVGFQWAAIAQLRPPADAQRCRAEAWLGGRLWIAGSYRPMAPPESGDQPAAAATPGALGAPDRLRDPGGRQSPGRAP